jgi:hypothetical protein
VKTALRSSISSMPHSFQCTNSDTVKWWLLQA